MTNQRGHDLDQTKALMTPGELARYIDHTLLKAEATIADIDRLCDEALRFHFKGVCVNSTYVERVKARLSGSNVLTVSVVGFPLGACLTASKAFEANLAVTAGADEIDMVIALGALKAGDHKFCERDIAAVVRAAGKAPVKVILETGLLTMDETQDACKISAAAGASFVKTATGFLGRGATLDDIRLMRANVPESVAIKASGGIKTFAQACELVQAGATRLGTSSGVALVSGDAISGSVY